MFASFHPVHIKHFGQHRGYEIWLYKRYAPVLGYEPEETDEPIVRLRDGVDLNRDEAYALARAWNA